MLSKGVDQVMRISALPYNSATHYREFYKPPVDQSGEGNSDPAMSGGGPMVSGKQIQQF
jgi:hypothetical protein